MCNACLHISLKRLHEILAGWVELAWSPCILSLKTLLKANFLDISLILSRVQELSKKILSFILIQIRMDRLLVDKKTAKEPALGCTGGPFEKPQAHVGTVRKLAFVYTQRVTHGNLDIHGGGTLTLGPRVISKGVAFVNLEDLLILFKIICSYHHHSNGPRLLHEPQLFTIGARATLHYGDLAPDLISIFKRSVRTKGHTKGQLAVDRFFAV
mmetsp:Transcript_70161/g.102819  ORF Transcript_70161/g.102819 Transcript_70161/m.102819 type:complete len:212 (+) Transcript_70161:305-940(+)